MRLLPVKHQIQLHPAGCLAAAAQMVLAYQEYDQSQNALNQLFGTTSIGTPLSRITRLEKLGFKVLLSSGNEINLRQAIDANQPIIVFVRTGELAYRLDDVQHAVVVVGYDDASFFINDPEFAQAPKKVEADELMLAMIEFDYRYALIVKQENP